LCGVDGFILIFYLYKYYLPADYLVPWIRGARGKIQVNRLSGMATKYPKRKFGSTFTRMVKTSAWDGQFVPKTKIWIDFYTDGKSRKNVNYVKRTFLCTFYFYVV